MIRRLLAWLRGSPDGERSDRDAEDDERFVPSRLDASVRDAHGGGDAEAERELARIDATATALEEHRHEE